MRRQKEQDRYFQTVARRYYQLRGAPFFLSPRELILIESWNEYGIPLPVVLEGMKMAYESYRSRPHKKGKTFSLAFCHDHVVKSFSQHKERKVGKRGKILDQPDKSEKVRVECERFLQNIPTQAVYLKEIFIRILDEFSEGKTDENRLEQFEEEIEALIVENADAEEKEEVRGEIRVEWSGREEWDRIYQLSLIKRVRERNKVPYVSPFYY